MNFHNQHRYSVVTLRFAQGLSRWAERCFPFATLRASAHALSMTGPTLNIKIQHRAGGGAKPLLICSSPLSRQGGRYNRLERLRFPQKGEPVPFLIIHFER